MIRLKHTSCNSRKIDPKNISTEIGVEENLLYPKLGANSWLQVTIPKSVLHRQIDQQLPWNQILNDSNGAEYHSGTKSKQKEREFGKVGNWIKN